MTQVITFQHKSKTFFVRAEQRDALNQALEFNSLPKCDTNPFEYKLDFQNKVETQPDDNKVYVPSNYSSEDFDALLSQDDYRSYIKSGEAQSELEGEQQDSEEKTEVKVDTPIQKAQKQLAKVVEKLGEVKYVADDKELTSEVEKIKTSFESQIKAFQDLIDEKFLEQSKLLDKLGKDLPAEDIDKIYFVHGDNPDINSKLSERRKEDFCYSSS
ncbi:MAG: hypothetical protein QNJ18_00765 [Xenococcaceae cyanobacterium MO_167.B52]|nr:hypothetical protein [Xenococcaceae cyanobacterium MO_167.B52]